MRENDGPLDAVPPENSLDPPAGIAHHEAAHIAVAWALGAQHLVSVDILPDGRFFGQAVFGIGLRGAATIADIVAILAGPEAVRRLDRRLYDFGAQDRRDADRAIRAMCRSTEAAAILLDHCRGEAARLVAGNWDAIEAIADALQRHGTLTGDDLNALLDDVLTDRAHAGKAARAAAWARAQENAAAFAAITMEHDPR